MYTSRQVSSTFRFCRLGFIVDFLSHAAIVGFMAGAAIVIGLQQLRGLLGISHFTTKTNVVDVLHSAFTSIDHPVSSARFEVLRRVRNSEQLASRSMKKIKFFLHDETHVGK